MIRRFSYKFTRSHAHIIYRRTSPRAFLRRVLNYLSLLQLGRFLSRLWLEGRTEIDQVRGVVFAGADWTANWINRLCTPAHALNRMKLSYHGSIPSCTRPVFFSSVPNSLSFCLPHSLTQSVSLSFSFFFCCNRKVCFLPLFA